MANPIRPGRILKEELAARAITGNRLALDLGVPANRIGAILAGKRAISAELALRLGRTFGGGAQFWLDLQSRHDLGVAENAHGAKIRRSVRAA